MIPDKTQRYPEGMDGIDIYEPIDREYAAWREFVRDFERDEQRYMDRQQNEEGGR